MRNPALGEVIEVSGETVRVAIGNCCDICVFDSRPECNGEVFQHFGSCNGYHFERYEAPARGVWEEGILCS